VGSKQHTLWLSICDCVIDFLVSLMPHSGASQVGSSLIFRAQTNYILRPMQSSVLSPISICVGLQRDSNLVGAGVFMAHSRC